jgi:hypothetical protein
LPEREKSFIFIAEMDPQAGKAELARLPSSHGAKQ